MSIVKKILVATAVATVLGMVYANKAKAVSVNLSSADLSTGVYNYNFELSTAEVDAFTEENLLLAADTFRLTGMSGIIGQGVSGSADTIYNVSKSTFTSAEWVVNVLAGSTINLLGPTTLGTFTVNAPGTQLGRIDYSVETTVSGTVPENCSLIGVRSTCTGTTQGPVTAAVPFELSPGLGSAALAFCGAIAYFKGNKKENQNLYKSTL